MKRIIILTSLTFFIIISCTKINSDYSPNVQQDNEIISISDSCSYSINGKVYTCDKVFTEGKGNAPTNFDLALNSWNFDTLQYYTKFGLYKYSSFTNKFDGKLVIYFIKKYPKNKLNYPHMGILSPVSDTPLYVKGIKNYAVDFKRFNKQEGIAMDITYINDSTIQDYYTYIRESPLLPSTLNDNCQINSKFEVTNVFKDYDNRLIIEAKFNANIFNESENALRIENGYLRIHVE